MLISTGFTTLLALFFHTDPIPFDEEGIQARLAAMACEVMPARYDPAVKSYLKTYTVRGRRSAQKILGRQLLYFPLFESILKQEGLPLDLKYLAVVESALDPRALSHAGAVGLWQFMAPTARFYGLRVDNQVDERCDPRLSTLAAVRYLKDLYARFGTWELAIAAYNSGSGRVLRAVKRGQSTDYWEIRSHLPRETASYVPGYIAATYLYRHADAHGLVPEWPALDLQLTSTIRVSSGISFEEISRLTGVSTENLTWLNPTFRKGIVPPSETGFDLLVPRRIAADLEAWLASPIPLGEKAALLASRSICEAVSREQTNSHYTATVYYTHHGETLEDLAAQFQCSPDQLAAWNELKESRLDYCQPLMVYHPGDLEIAQDKEMGPYVKRIPIADLPGRLGEDNLTRRLSETRAEIREEGYQYYTVQKPRTLFEIAMEIEGVTFEELLSWNNLERNLILRPGWVIRVKQK